MPPVTKSKSDRPAGADLPRITPQLPGSAAEVTSPGVPALALGELPDEVTQEVPGLRRPGSEGPGVTVVDEDADVVVGQFLEDPGGWEPEGDGPVELLAEPARSLFDRSSTPLSLEEEPIPLPGTHPVSVHLLDGRITRGWLRNADLNEAELTVHADTGGVERLARQRIKAVFFAAIRGSAVPVHGERIRVTLQDRRQLAGYSSDHRGLGVGFFVAPADPRLPRVFLYRHAVSRLIIES